MRWTMLWVLALGLGMAAADGAKPNIILVMTDDQGYGEMSCHGNPILQTPNLDRLHRESVRFVDFMVSPTCAPTRAALLTGRHEFKNGVTHTIYERERLSLGATTLAEVLQRAGYATGIFGKWHLGDEDAYQPNRRGFTESFIHGGGGIGQTYPGSCGDAPGNKYFDPVIRHNGKFVKTRGYCTDVFFAEAMRWMEKQDGKPFFVYITPNAPHDPFVSPGPHYDRMFEGHGLSTNAVQYYSMIRNIDDNVGRLLERLDATGLARRTLVIFMTDNGHSIGNVFNAGMRAMKGNVYQGGVRVPSFWRWPGKLEAGDRTQLAAHIDLFPTLVEISGARMDRSVKAQVEGRSLVPVLRKAEHPWPDRYLVAHFGRWATGRAEEWKYKRAAIRNERFKLVDNTELYDLRNDPGETTNVIEQNVAIVATLRAEYDRWWREVRPKVMENEFARGPEVNPFKAAFWEQFGGSAPPEMLEVMNPQKKFP